MVPLKQCVLATSLSPVFILWLSSFDVFIRKGNLPLGHIYNSGKSQQEVQGPLKWQRQRYKISKKKKKWQRQWQVEWVRSNMTDGGFRPNSQWEPRQRPRTIHSSHRVPVCTQIHAACVARNEDILHTSDTKCLCFLHIDRYLDQEGKGQLICKDIRHYPLKWKPTKPERIWSKEGQESFPLSTHGP